MSCAHCERSLGTYILTCEGCKTRLVQNENCKYLRKVLVEYYSPQYGEFEGWKDGKTCECDKVCKRKAAVKKPNEQQVNDSGKKASGKR